MRAEDSITVKNCFAAIHNAFRRDIREIDELAYAAAREGKAPTAVVGRLDAFMYMLDFHAQCEDALILPALERVAPLLAYPYQADHDEIGVTQESWQRLRESPDPLDVARLTAALKEHVLLHLHKEDEQLYPVVDARVSPDEQAHILRDAVGEVPTDEAAAHSPPVAPYALGLMDYDDRETMVRWFQQYMPPAIWVQTKVLIRNAIKADWAELVRRCPDLR